MNVPSCLTKSRLMRLCSLFSEITGRDDHRSRERAMRIEVHLHADAPAPSVPQFVECDAVINRPSSCRLRMPYNERLVWFDEFAVARA